MSSVVSQLLGSKRFFLYLVALIVCASFVIAGRLTTDALLDYYQKLTALLMALYGAEEVASAWKQNAPAPISSTTVHLVNPDAFPPDPPAADAGKKAA